MTVIIKKSKPKTIVYTEHKKVLKKCEELQSENKKLENQLLEINSMFNDSGLVSHKELDRLNSLDSIIKTKDIKIKELEEKNNDLLKIISDLSTSVVNFSKNQ